MHRRDAVILRMLLESGARASEILGLTGKGLRQAHNPKIGIDIFAFVRNKGEHVANKPIWCSAETREQLRRYLARERSKLDSQARTRLEELGDDDPIFLSRRKRQLGYSGFRIVFDRLLRKAQRHFAASTPEPAAIPVPLPTVTPHTIRHLHTTFGSSRCANCSETRRIVVGRSRRWSATWAGAARRLSRRTTTP